MTFPIGNWKVQKCHRRFQRQRERAKPMVEIAVGLILCVLATPFWVLAVLTSPLRKLVEPRVRSDLATTPIVPELYLRESLGAKLPLARLPAYAGAVGVGLVALSMLSGSSSQGHYAQGWAIVSYIALFAGFFTILMERVATLGALNAAVSACERGTELPVWRATASTLILLARFAFVTWGAIVLTDFASGYFDLIPNRRHRELASVAVGLVIVVGACLVAHRRQILAWRRLAVVYLQMEPPSR
ncbi:MAG: hypothetical protein SF028_15735 [Candidatus Sumerlaeia bacterium]|nr:hypothetical protein [Candidatus Sumerlaeia bacterium]